jgi:hypothetical protein
MLRLAMEGQGTVSSADANALLAAPACGILSHPRWLQAVNRAGQLEPSRAARIIHAFFDSRERSMEAERLNLIETNLADLARRAEELRGYL